jgi:hypothetical protein
MLRCPTPCPLPAGRAAQRMAELVSHSACTVHRLLGYKPGSASSSEGDSALESADDEDAGGLEDILQRCNPHSLAEADVGACQQGLLNQWI